MTSQAATRDAEGIGGKVGHRLVLATLCLAQFMLILDIVAVNVALPSIKEGLQIPEARLQLTSIAYTLTFGSLLIVAGRAGDLFGRRRLFLVGLGVFTLASVLTGTAQTGWSLFAGRALQGVGAAMVSPTALALVTSSFAEGRERNWALGIMSAVGSGGAISGQLLGGVITDLAGWRWIFLINVPIGALVAVAALRLIREERATARTRLDLRGAVLLAAGLAAVTIALSRIAEHGLGSGVIPFLAAVVLFAAFVLHERRRSAPLVRIGLLGKAGIWTGNLVLTLNAGALGSALFFSTLYLQQVLDYSPLVVGLAFAPVTLVVLVVAPQAARLTTRFGVRTMMLAGSALLGLGMLYLATVPVAGSYAVNVLPGLALCALGSGLSYVPTFIAGTSGVSDEEQGLASGLLNTSQEVGTAIGLALLASLSAWVARAGDLAGTEALTAGYRAGFVGAAVLMGLALLVAVRAPRSIGRARSESPVSDAGMEENVSLCAGD